MRVTEGSVTSTDPSTSTDTTGDTAIMTQMNLIEPQNRSHLTGIPIAVYAPEVLQQHTAMHHT